MLQGENLLEKHHLSPYFMSNYRRFAPDSKDDISKTVIEDQSGDSQEERKRPPSNLSVLEQSPGKISLKATLEGIETMYINKALVRAGYNISKAGRYLDLTPQALRYKINKLNIHLPDE